MERWRDGGSFPENKADTDTTSGSRAAGVWLCPFFLLLFLGRLFFGDPGLTEKDASELRVLIVVRSRPKCQRQRPDPARGSVQDYGCTQGSQPTMSDRSRHPLEKRRKKLATRSTYVINTTKTTENLERELRKFEWRATERPGLAGEHGSGGEGQGEPLTHIV